MLRWTICISLSLLIHLLLFCKKFENAPQADISNHKSDLFLKLHFADEPRLEKSIPKAIHTDKGFATKKRASIPSRVSKHPQISTKNSTSLGESLAHNSSDQTRSYTIEETREQLLVDGGFVHPTYPLRARRSKMEGLVKLSLHIADGTLVGSTILQSSGHTLLDEAALDAIRKWRFRKVSTQLVQTVRFHLH